MTNQERETPANQQTTEDGQTKKKRINSIQDIRKRKVRRKRLIALIVLLIIVGSGLLFFTARQRAAAEAAEAEARATATHTVTSRRYREEVEISGNVVPYKSENLFFRTTGEVKEVLVEEGDHVAAGDVVALLKRSSKEFELAQLEFEIEQAEHEGSRKQLELLDMRRNLLLDEIGHTNLKAGISGRVSRVNIDPGDAVGANPTEPAVRIVDITALKATVEVDEFDINTVELGQEAELIFDALGSGTPVAARVYSIPLEGFVTGQGIAVKEIKLVIEDPPQTISPAYTFSGVIFAGEEQSVLTFPQEFLQYDNDTQYVQKRRNEGDLVRIEVETAYYERGRVRLISGDINEGDTLVRRRDTTARSSSFIMGPPSGRR